MKKFLAVLLVFAMAAMTFMACGTENTDESKETEAQSENQSSEAADLDSDYVVANGKLIVGITDFEPMDYKDENGNWIGFDADMAKAFAEKLGVTCEFIEIDWESKEMELQNKTIDCVWNGMTLTDGVKEAMETSNAYCNNAQIVVVKKEKKDELKESADAKGLKFAVEAGSAGEDAAKEQGYDYTAVETQAAAVMEVAAGTADACIIDSLMAAAMVGEGTSYPELAYTVELTSEEYGVGFRKGSDLAAKLNDFFKECQENGTLKEIAEKYGTQASLIEQK